MRGARGNNFTVTDANSGASAPSETPFHDLDAFLRLPRLSGLRLSPDGSRLVTVVSGLNDDATKHVPALWEIDPEGERAARQLTHGARGESSPAFAPNGDLLFVAARGKSDEDPATAWRLPRDGAEAVEVARSPLGISSVMVPRERDATIVTMPVFPSASDDAGDERIRDARRSGKVSAILHTGYPVRYWDHDLGPEVPCLAVVDANGAGQRIVQDAALREAGIDVDPSGSFAVTVWNEAGPLGVTRAQLMRLDLVTGERSVIARENDADFGMPTISPDGMRIAYVREAHADPETAPDVTIHVHDLSTGKATRIAVGWDRWATALAWLPDGTGLVVTADQYGRAPLFLVSATSPKAAVRALTTDDAAYSDACIDPSGRYAYALRAAISVPPAPVRIDLETGELLRLPAPASVPAVPGRVTEVLTSGDDGTPIRAWLALPATASEDSPAPLLLWIHGGPLASWNTWQWRWNPWLMVAHGYAVLLPDPALSTGFGRRFIQRGWGEWGNAPYTDLMALTDATEQLPEIDESRTAAMGGSFGGYMANWIAGHTNRFAAIVSHAGLWALDQFAPTTDAAWYWAREMTPEMAVDNSPHLYVADINTPMLVIHGDKDYRVPIGEALRLWFELNSESGLPSDDHGISEHQFLSFPDEHHWILKPQHTKVWYETVLAFLAGRMGAGPAALPDVLGVALPDDDEE